MENLCNNHGHFHAEVSNVVLDFEENARNSNFLATTSEIPIPLLSISLSGDLGRNKGHSQPLFQSSIKRQMTGLSIAFLKQCITTELTFESKQDHAPLRFRVQSIAADRNYGEVCGFFN